MEDKGKKSSNSGQDVENSKKITKSESSDQPTSSEEPINKRTRIAGSAVEGAEEKPETKKTNSSIGDLQEEDSAASSGGLRTFKRIPIFIVDYHNDVLEFIYRCLGSRHLPLKNNTLLHFDSHADMVISRDIPASSSYDKDTMLSELSIENWIMPACYAGHFNRVIWMKNSWCRQIPVGKYNFKIGHKHDKICVDCNLDYFVSEGSFCNTAELEQVREVELQVINADDVKEPPNPQELLSTDNGSSYILDIDLDFFSTSNPFLEIYKEANCYAQLTQIFHFISATASNAAETTEKRKEQLDALKAVFEHLEAKRDLDRLQRPPADIISPEIFEKIEKLVESLQKYYAEEEIDWLLIFDSGSTTDTDGLPHHISTDKELNLYYAQFKEFLKKLPHNPVLITMSCSAEDDYCPRNQVGSIQEKVVKILQEVFGDKVHEKPILYYMDDEWDVMKL